MAAKARTRLTSLERLERQLQAITLDHVQGGAWGAGYKGLDHRWGLIKSSPRPKFGLVGPFG